MIKFFMLFFLFLITSSGYAKPLTFMFEGKIDGIFGDNISAIPSLNQLVRGNTRFSGHFIYDIEGQEDINRKSTASFYLLPTPSNELVIRINGQQIGTRDSSPDLMIFLQDTPAFDKVDISTDRPKISGLDLPIDFAGISFIGNTNLLSKESLTSGEINLDHLGKGEAQIKVIMSCSRDCDNYSYKVLGSVTKIYFNSPMIVAEEVEPLENEDCETDESLMKTANYDLSDPK